MASILDTYATLVRSRAGSREAAHVLKKTRKGSVGVDQQPVVKADGFHDWLVFLDKPAKERLADLETLLALGVAALGPRRRGDRPSVRAAVGRRRPRRHREDCHPI